MASKDQIIAVASRLFVEKGFEKTTMEDIGNALGVYKGSLYHHIDSKAEIFYQILRLSVNESTKKLKKVRQSNMEAEEKFKKIIRVHFENIINYSLEYQIIMNERRYMLNRKQEKQVRKKMKEYENYLFEVIKEGIEAKVFRNDLNPRVIVAGILGTGNALYKWFAFDGPLSFDDIVRIYLDFFMQGLKYKDV